MRWIATLLAISIAAGIGVFVGYTRWGTAAKRVEQVEQRLQTANAETSSLRAEKQELEQRLQQLTKEQERLAQENDILRKQRATEQVVGGAGGELPVLPPK